MLTLHIAELMMWACTLMRLGSIARAYDAPDTTLGYGTVDLEAQWRNISPIIGISGLFTFAWTTSALVDVVASHRQLIEQLEDEREREINLRSTLRKAEWDALMTERDAERSEGERTRTRSLILPAMQNLVGERKRVQELRQGRRRRRSTRTKRSSVRAFTGRIASACTIAGYNLGLCSGHLTMNFLTI